jgi:hypothetical protein
MGPNNYRCRYGKGVHQTLACGKLPHRSSLRFARSVDRLWGGDILLGEDRQKFLADTGHDQ